MRVLRAAGHLAVPEGEPSRYREHHRGVGLSVGTYCIPVGGKDGQHPHTEDLVYLVVRGRARLRSGAGDVQVGPGTVIYVAAREQHHLVDVSEDLSVVVVFGTAERWRE